MIRAWTEAIVRPGHRVASGTCGDPRFPNGTIRPQLPFFRKAMPDFEAWCGTVHPGTINLRVPGIVRLTAERPTVEDVAWTDAFPPETFYLSRAIIDHREATYRAWLYVPDPATKPDHLQQGDTIELLAGLVPGLAYGDRVTLRYDPAFVAIVTAAR